MAQFLRFYKLCQSWFLFFVYFAHFIFFNPISSGGEHFSRTQNRRRNRFPSFYIVLLLLHQSIAFPPLVSKGDIPFHLPRMIINNKLNTQLYVSLQEFADFATAVSPAVVLYVFSSASEKRILPLLPLLTSNRIQFTCLFRKNA